MASYSAVASLSHILGETLASPRKPLCTRLIVVNARWIPRIWGTSMDSAPGRIELEYRNRIGLVAGKSRARGRHCALTNGSAPEPERDRY
jgi:hypothetical protein